MAEAQERYAERPAEAATAPRCPSCASLADRRLLRILDPATGRTVGVHGCRCGAVVWDER